MRRIKKRFIWGCTIGIILVLIGCGGKSRVEENNSYQEMLVEENMIATPDMGREEGEYIAEAEDLIWKAFSFDTKEVEPLIDTCNDMTSISYEITSSDFFIVEFLKESVYPSTLYHFCHLGEDKDFDLAEESEEYFKDEMIEVSTEFLNEVYGIDCTDANIHAYGYANKIAVQVEIASDQVFQVKFYYKDLKPVGVQFCSDLKGFERMMEKNQAKKYF